MKLSHMLSKANIFFSVLAVIMLLSNCSKDEEPILDDSEPKIVWDFSAETKPDLSGDERRHLTLGSTEIDNFFTIIGLPDTTSFVKVDIEISGGLLNFQKDVTVTNGVASFTLDKENIDEIEEALDDDEQLNVYLSIAKFSWKSIKLNVVKSFHRIYSWHDLNNVRRFLNKDYLLEKSIELPNPGIDGMPEEGFIPIGGHIEFDGSFNNTVHYKGIFDGQGFTISNLYIDQPERDNVGLFGSISTYSGVKNLKLSLSPINSEFSIRGKNNVGSLIGLSHAWISTPEYPNSAVKNVHVENGIVRGGNFVGGLIGDVLFIRNSGAENVTIYGDYNVGGVFGRNNSQYILEELYFIGSVIGESSIGGIAGTSRANFINSYTHSNLTANGTVGGLAGFGYNTPENCYVICSFQGEALETGMILGNDLDGDYSSNVFYHDEISDFHSGNANGLSLVELKDIANYPSTWDFERVWTISPVINHGYPYLRDSWLK